MDLEVVVLLLVTTLVGSACGLRAAFQIPALTRRLAALEDRFGPAPFRTVAPPAPTTIVQPPVVDRGAKRGGGGDLGGGDRPRVERAAEAPRPAPAPVRAPENDSWRAFELRAGTRWITWLGAAALVIGAALFIKLAIDEGWLGPAARFALGVACGLALLAVGHRAHRADMRPLAQGLFGAGLGVLYVATFVAFSTHDLIPRQLAFVMLVGVTIVGCAIAVRHDAQPVAILALVGGLVTPAAVSSGVGARDALFAYLLVLDLGVVGLALVRRWRALDLVALAGTFLLFGGWLERGHEPAQWRAELAWLAGFYVVFLVLPFAFHLWRKVAIPSSRFWLATAGAAITLGFAAVIVDDRQGLGAVSLVMAASCATICAVAHHRLVGDGRAHLGFATLTGVLATLAVPLALADHGITLAWSIEAPVLLLLGFRYRWSRLRVAGLGVLGLAAVNVGIQYLPLSPASVPVANLAFANAMIVPVVAIVFAILHRALAKRFDLAERVGAAAAIGGASLGLSIIHLELGSAAAPFVWAVGSMIALGVATWSRWGMTMATAFAGVAGYLVLQRHGHSQDPALLVLNARFGAGVIACGAFAAIAIVSGRRGDAKRARIAWIVALVGLGCVLGAEARTGFLLSVVWSAYAAGLLAVGFARRNRALRLAGLGLLGVVALKLVVHDLADVAPLHRVLSFFIVGALMILASYSYHRLEQRR